MKKLMLFLCILSIWACGNDTPKDSGKENKAKPKSMIKKAKPDDGKGIGEIKSVALNSPLDQAMITNGKAIYELKCAACHKLSDKRVVGPGWKGVTEKRKPEWIMNMVLNVDIMLDKDPTAQALFKECLTRMPNQNLTESDARDVLEFMLDNDVK